MIGNNSCGATAQRTGKVVDNIARLEVLLYDGTRFWCGETTDDEYAEIERHGDRQAEIYRQLRRLRDDYAEEIRARYPDIPRRVSGYNLDSLLPEHDFDVAGCWSAANPRWSPSCAPSSSSSRSFKERSLVVLGFDSIAAAADAVPAVAPPRADRAGRTRSSADPRPAAQGHQLPARSSKLPEGNGYLLVQFGGDTKEETDRAAQRMLDALDESEHDRRRRVPRRARPKKTSCGRPARPGSAPPPMCPANATPGRAGRTPPSPPDRLGDYLRDLDDALRAVRLRRRHRAQLSTGTSGKAASTPASPSA